MQGRRFSDQPELVLLFLELYLLIQSYSLLLTWYVMYSGIVCHSWFLCSQDGEHHVAIVALSFGNI